MLVVDASCLFEDLSGGPCAEAVRARLESALEACAPHVIDVEVLGVVRRDRKRGLLDQTAADQIAADLRDWPGERFDHRPLLERAWELRDTLRIPDAMYVALAEALDAPLLTLDARLAAAPGPRCPIECLRRPAGAGLIDREDGGAG
ncbi:MAG: type II toxin-antitoxin system VapC family toxin [Bifidobacteriaceae bacterium]|jgi:predicted nucleic acid-binding protein|nr:type II toxin-antitoxin system VapC family toxin [Bifidobacteriaceae bacterium]